MGKCRPDEGRRESDEANDSQPGESHRALRCDCIGVSNDRLGRGENQRQLRRHIRLDGADLGRQGSAAFREAGIGPQSGVHLGRSAQYYVASGRKRSIRQSLWHARFGGVSKRRGHGDDCVAAEHAGAFVSGAEEYYNH